MTKNEKLTHYANRIIGKKWKARTYNYDEIDCYGVIILFYKDYLGIDLDCYGYNENVDFDKCVDNFFGSQEMIMTNFVDADVFIAYFNGSAIHTGLVIGDCCLHSLEDKGVRLDKVSVINRMYDDVRFYKIKVNHGKDNH